MRSVRDWDAPPAPDILESYDDTADVAQQVTAVVQQAVVSAPAHSRLQLLDDILLDHKMLDDGQPVQGCGEREVNSMALPTLWLTRGTNRDRMDNGTWSDTPQHSLRAPGTV